MTESQTLENETKTTKDRDESLVAGEIYSKEFDVKSDKIEYKQKLGMDSLKSQKLIGFLIVVEYNKKKYYEIVVVR